MTDIRRIEVEKRTQITAEIDVDKWFTEFAAEWEDYENDEFGRKLFIEETAHELAFEGALPIGAISYVEEDYDLEVYIYKVKT